jgi:ribosomal protein L20
MRVEKGLQYQYVMRKLIKRNMRGAWISSINSGMMHRIDIHLLRLSSLMRLSIKCVQTGLLSVYSLLFCCVDACSGEEL